MWKLIVGNPWALAALFALGLAFGGSGAWWVQGQRLAATQARSWAAGIRPDTSH